MPDSENNERAILHAQSQLGSIRAKSHATNCFLHVTAGDQGMVSQAPQPKQKDKVKNNPKPTSHSHQPAQGREACLFTTLMITRKDTVTSH